MGCGQQGLHGASHLIGAVRDRSQGFLVVGGIAFATQSEFGLGLDLGHGGAQLMRHLSREAPLAAKTRRQSVEHAVQCVSQLRDLIVRISQLETPVEILRTPGLGLGGHCRDRTEGGVERPAPHEPHDDEQSCGESHRREPGEPQSAGVPAHVQARHDCAYALLPFVVVQRLAVQTNLLLGDVCVLGQLAVQRFCRLREGRLDTRGTHGGSAHEHPDLGAEFLHRARRLKKRHPAVHDTDLGALVVDHGIEAVVGIGGKAYRQQEVESHGHRDQGDSYRYQHRQ
jgi:hypothetical protein